jgi:ABC-type multidrug transport system ATPase subunit
MGAPRLGGGLVAEGLVGGPVGGVDLDLGPGLTVVTGEDGCGTSTLLRLLAGEQVATAGTVRGGPAALLPAPPGDDWQPTDVVRYALRAPYLVGRPMVAMSNGERQRVRIATLLARPAPVLLLDEPLGYLDDVGVRQVLEALAADGRPTLLVSKTDPRPAAAADRVLTMVDGRLVG